MHFWQVGIVSNLLAVLALLAAAGLLVRSIGSLRRLAVPPAILAGVLGLALGDSGAGVLPTDSDVLEILVYHGFAVVFIAVGLQAASGGRASGAAARSLMVAIPTFAIVQMILGFVLVGAWWLLTRTALHPGFALMIPLGFSQGPGQALALGSAWEGHGLTDGGQIGLVFAALGFAYCGILGVPLVAWARRRGILDPLPDDPGAPPSDARGGAREASLFEPLSTQVVLVGVVYIGVFGVLSGLTALLPEDSALASTFWGFHFIVGAGLAIALRRTARRLDREAIFDDDLLARMSVLAVDLTTAGAIAAVRLDVLGAWLGPILVFTAVAGIVTLVVAVWLGRRAFPNAPFSHTLALFGMATGTVSTGLALVRMVDPELRGPVARNVVIGATAAVPLGIPVFLGIVPFAVTQWSSGFGPALTWPLLASVGYLAVLAWFWRRITPAHLLRPLSRLWP